MSKVLQEMIIQTIDKRIAKFSTTARRRTTKRYKFVRLDPLNRSNTGSAAPPSEGESQPCSVDTTVLADTINVPVKPKTFKRKWIQFTQTLLQQDSSHQQSRWDTLVAWKEALTRGVREIELNRKRKINASTYIAKIWKGQTAFNRFNNLKKAVGLIKSHWNRVLACRKLKKMKKAALTLALFSKLRHRIKETAVRVIQKVFRGFKVRQVYKPQIQQLARRRHHEQMKQRQASLRDDKRKKAQAVATIEDGYLTYLNKQRMREYRKYLWTLPYECRVLFLKFKQVKQDADNLKADVDSMIAKKLEETQMQQ